MVVGRKLWITLDARVPFERQFYALSGAVVSKLCSVRGRLEMDGSDSSNRDERWLRRWLIESRAGAEMGV